MTVDLAALAIADPPAVWEALGFTVASGAVRVGTTTLHLGANGKGIVGWGLSGLAEGTDVDGIPNGRSGSAATETAHANGVVAIDHLVVMTPSVERTVGVLEGHGLPCRRRRDGEAYGMPMRQAFFWLGTGGEQGTILEVVGPPEPDPAGGPAKFFGICFTVADLDVTGAFFGERMKPPFDAVQPGRRITTISSKAGSSVAIALMSPHVKQSDTGAQ